MSNAEKKFEELRTHVNQLDTGPIHERVEGNLRSAWRQAQLQDEVPAKKWNWRILSYALGASGVTALALITTVSMSPDAPRSMTQQVATEDEEYQEGYALDASLGSSAGLGQPLSVNNFITEPFIIEPTTNRDKSYTYGEGSAQLLDESVNLSIDVKDDMLSVIHQLREQVTAQNGYLLNISYYGTSGTIDVQLPASELNAFEEVLEKLDANHKVEVVDYRVVNISERIVTIDEDIKSTQQAIDEDKAKLTVSDLTEGYRKIIQDRIIANEEHIKTQNAARAEEIAKYNLITVRVSVNEYASFWEGDYYQHDRSTLSGMVKYEISRALYMFIGSFGTVLRFIVLILIYSVIWVPVFLLIRGAWRKIVRAIQNRKK